MKKADIVLIETMRGERIVSRQLAEKFIDELIFKHMGRNDLRVYPSAHATCYSFFPENWEKEVSRHSIDRKMVIVRNIYTNA